MAATKALKTMGVSLTALAVVFGLSYYSEWPKYRFEQAARAAANVLPGARLVSSERVVELDSPVSWFWPPVTTLNFAMPDPYTDGRFYLISMLDEHGQNNPDVFLLDVDCKERKGEWYDLDEPETAFPARDVWGDPVVAPNGKTYRRMKTNILFPPEWPHAFCDTNWNVEREAIVNARLGKGARPPSAP
jgi:hypothetical protein